MTTEEIWRPVLRWEGFYEVSSHGRIRRVLSEDCKYRYLKPSIGSHGYFGLTFNGGGKAEGVVVHRVVAEAFLDRPPEAEVVRHLDGSKENNHLANLAWGTHSENRLDDVRLGVNFWANKETCDRGHLLKNPNLRNRPSRPRSRECLSCHRERSASVAGKRHFDPERATKRYNDLMNGGSGKWHDI